MLIPSFFLFSKFLTQILQMENESSFAVGEDGFIDLGTLSNINEDEIRINS